MLRLGSVFIWELKLPDFDEFFFVIGNGDRNAVFVTGHPDDAAAQNKHILENIKRIIEDTGFTIHDIVSLDIYES